MTCPPSHKSSSPFTCPPICLSTRLYVRLPVIISFCALVVTYTSIAVGNVYVIPLSVFSLSLGLILFHFLSVRICSSPFSVLNNAGICFRPFHFSDHLSLYRVYFQSKVVNQFNIRFLTLSIYSLLFPPLPLISRLSFFN